MKYQAVPVLQSALLCSSFLPGEALTWFWPAIPVVRPAVLCIVNLTSRNVRELGLIGL